MPAQGVPRCLSRRVPQRSKAASGPMGHRRHQHLREPLRTVRGLRPRVPTLPALVRFSGVDLVLEIEPDRVEDRRHRTVRTMTVRNCPFSPELKPRPGWRRNFGLDNRSATGGSMYPNTAQKRRNSNTAVSTAFTDLPVMARPVSPTSSRSSHCLNASRSPISTVRQYTPLRAQKFKKRAIRGMYARIVFGERSAARRYRQNSSASGWGLNDSESIRTHHDSPDTGDTARSATSTSQLSHT